MERVVLLTGGNLGDVASTLAKARKALAAKIGCEVAASSVMRSEPWGFDRQEPAHPVPEFLNQVLVLETSLSPEEVLNVCLETEKELGRERPEPASLASHASFSSQSSRKTYLSRTIDIDILFYGDRIIDTPQLKIPHPLIARREFVLRPLAEAMPGLRHPVTGLTPQEMLEDLNLK